MNDLFASLFVIGGAVLIALGVRVIIEIVVDIRERRIAKPAAMLAAWPQDGTILPCQSWVGREIAAPVIAEAEQIIVRRWQETAQIEESSDE